MTLVVAPYPIVRVGKPDAAVALDHHVVGRIETPALELIRQHGHPAIELGPCDAPLAVFAGYQTSLAVPCIAIRIIGRLPKDFHVPAFEPAHHSIVWNITPDQGARITEPNGTLRPARPGKELFDKDIPQDALLHARIDDLKIWRQHSSGVLKFLGKRSRAPTLCLVPVKLAISPSIAGRNLTVPNVYRHRR